MAIPNTIQHNHHVGNVIEDIQMGMRAEDFVHVAFMFENLYSDPIAAVIREYSTNGWDSHVFANNTDRPIEVTLPSTDNLEFSVQDYGVGMSIDTLREVYSMYGASDKRNTNAVAGQLGMGSKSGLSYATAFTITAVRNGVRVIAMSTKDEHGLGVLKILDTSGTDEPNGVKITIPVETYDVNRFIEAAERQFQFWEPGTVLVNGKAPAVPEWRATALPLDEHTWLVRPDAGLYRSYVVMGNVAYPVPDVNTGRGSHRFVAYLNIGDVDFAPSREEVRHSPHTNATLRHLSEYVSTTYKRALSSALATTTSRWEETMLKTLWMDRNVNLTSVADRPMWTYNPTAYGNKAKSHFRYRISSLAGPNTVVITGFPSKNVSAQSRDRLDTFVADKGVKNPSFVILPDGLGGLSALEGRPNTFTWDEVVGATKVDPVVKAKVKREKYETVYTIVGKPGMTGAELAEVDGDVLFLYPGESARYGDMGATVVALYSTAQEARVKRFVPTIVHYDEAVEAKRAAATAAVTDYDRKVATARLLSDVYANLDASTVVDPELAEAIRLHKVTDTPTMTAARKIHAEIKVGKNPTEKFNARYPLMDHLYSYRLGTPAARKELVLYLNAAYESRQAAKAEAEAAQQAVAS